MASVPSHSPSGWRCAMPTAPSPTPNHTPSGPVKVMVTCPPGTAESSASENVTNEVALPCSLVAPALHAAVLRLFWLNVASVPPVGSGTMAHPAGSVLLLTDLDTHKEWSVSTRSQA